MNEVVSISRANSLSRSASRASRHGSTVSRSQSLIQKNIATHDLRPSDILIERFTAWKAIVKQLISYFEGIADIENNVAREMTKLAGIIQVPFRSGNQFLGEGGLQDVFYGIRDKTRAIADQHANLGRTVDGSIVQHLEKLKTEIKAHIKNIQNDTGKLATAVAKERELSAKYIGDLSTNVSIYKNTPLSITAKTDPYVANQAVSRQLVKQVHTENALQKSLLLTQASSAMFEASLVQAIQSAWATFSEWRTRMDNSVGELFNHLQRDMSALPPDREWITFAAREDHLVDPETPLRDPQVINYPSKDDPSVLPVHIGLLERKKRYTRTYKESYYVLTAAGFLHEYSSSDPAVGHSPMFSLFLPLCTLGPPSASSAKSHKFHIEERKDGTGATNSGSFRHMKDSLIGRGRSTGRAWAFRARSHEDMMEWWNDVRMLCARYLVASEQMERDGPVLAAVRAAGYTSEDDGEETDEGSSIEEEADEDDDAVFVEARDVADVDGGEEAGPPEYTHAGATVHGVHGANGYPVDKKDSAGLGRRLSRRQEKAPAEAHPAHPGTPGPGHGLGPDPAADEAEVGETSAQAHEHGLEGESAGVAAGHSRFAEDL